MPNLRTIAKPLNRLVGWVDGPLRDHSKSWFRDGKERGVAPPRNTRRIFGFSLEHLRTAAGWAAAAMLGGGISASTGDHSHHAMTYVFWYGCAGLFVVSTIVMTGVTERRGTERPAGPTVKYGELEVTGRPSESASELLQAVRVAGLLVETPESPEKSKDEPTEQ